MQGNIGESKCVYREYTWKGYYVNIQGNIGESKCVYTEYTWKGI